MLNYIDPGTGSMLFTILISVLGAGAYSMRDKFVKMKFRLSGGRSHTLSDEHAEYVIFSDHKRYWNVFEPICDEFEKRNVAISYLTASEDDPALEKEYDYVSCRFIGEGNKAFTELNSLNADIVLSTTPSLDVFYWKRSRNVKYYVHVPHAAGNLSLYRMFGLDYYDAVLVSGGFQKDQVRAIEAVRHLPKKEIRQVGLTFFDSMKKRLDSEKAPAHKGVNVLLAPSWGPSSIFNKYGSRIIDALLETNHHIIIRPHPQSLTSEKTLIDSLIAGYPDSDRIEWNTDNDNFNVLQRSDIMISDFSGVMYDFCLVFDKPLIYTDVNFDTAPYDAAWLNETPWTFRILPDLGIRLTEDNLSDISELIDTCMNDKRYEAGRRKVREEAWPFIGESASRITDYLLDKHAQLTQTIS